MMARFHGLPVAQNQHWPGVDYPWLPDYWSRPTAPQVLPHRLCLGADCWNLRRLSFADAGAIVAVLRRRSAPVAEAGLLATALYQAGYKAQAQAVERMYAGRDGVAEFRGQINRVYDGSTAGTDASLDFFLP